MELRAKYVSADEVRKDYTGYEKDEESGLEFAQARYYNTTHGRFTSVDPLTASATIRNPQTFNRYSYALNSPYKFTDPLATRDNSPVVRPLICHELQLVVSFSSIFCRSVRSTRQREDREKWCVGFGVLKTCGSYRAKKVSSP